MFLFQFFLLLPGGFYMRALIYIGRYYHVDLEIVEVVPDNIDIEIEPDVNEELPQENDQNGNYILF